MSGRPADLDDLRLVGMVRMMRIGDQEAGDAARRVVERVAFTVLDGVPALVGPGRGQLVVGEDGLRSGEAIALQPVRASSGRPIRAGRSGS